MTALSRRASAARWGTTLACVLAIGVLISLGPTGQAQFLEKKALSLEAAREMARAAGAEAERNQWRGVTAVVDDGGWLIVLERMNHER
jgi:glc operon protein GlcG